MNLQALLADITGTPTTGDGEEGFSRVPYDDAQPKVPLKTGVTVKGTVTFGHGLTFITEDESRAIVGPRLQALFADLCRELPWVELLSDARQRALTDMAYNLGEHGLEGFTTFLSLMAGGQFGAAADDLTGTLWYREVGSRALKIEALIRNG